MSVEAHTREVQLDWEASVSAFIQAQQEAQEALWRMGEIAAQVDRTYGTRSIPKFASEVGYSARRIYELAANWSAWESKNRERSHSLSFAHHEAIEEVAGSDEEAMKLMARAEDEQMSVREIRRIKTPEETEEKNLEVVEMVGCPKCGEVYPMRDAVSYTAATGGKGDSE